MSFDGSFTQRRVKKTVSYEIPGNEKPRLYTQKDNFTPLNLTILKIVPILVLSFFTCTVQGQRLSLEFLAGTSNYQGDLREKRYTFQDAKAAFGIGAAYDLTDHISLRGLFTFTSLRADDKDNSDPSLVLRNLNFRTSIAEFSGSGQYFLFNTETSRVNPYVFVGIALYHFNPYTYDTLGAKTYLQPLGTEGQGLSLYPEKKMYGRTQVAIPFGGGLRFTVSDNFSLGLEIGMRKLFTDYLDDVSTNYADKAALQAARGPKAVELAYRSDELKTGNPVYPAGGTKRGSPTFQDWYYITGLTANFRIHTQGNTGMGRSRGTGCPVNVY